MTIIVGTTPYVPPATPTPSVPVAPATPVPVSNTLTLDLAGITKGTGQSIPTVTIKVNGVTYNTTSITADQLAGQHQTVTIDLGATATINNIEISVANTSYTDSTHFSNAYIDGVRFNNQYINLSTATVQHGAVDVNNNIWSNAGTITFGPVPTVYSSTASAYDNTLTIDLGKYVKGTPANTAPDITLKINGHVVQSNMAVTGTQWLPHALQELTFDVAKYGTITSLEVDVHGASYTNANNFSNVYLDAVKFNGQSLTLASATVTNGGVDVNGYIYENNGGVALWNNINLTGVVTGVAAHA